MRLEARALEGNEVRTALVPLKSLLTFKQETKHGVNWWIAQTKDPESEVDSLDWEPRLAWRTFRDEGDTREFEEWVNDVDWAGIWAAPDELDPSGGEATPTPAPSPESSSTPAARGRSSSRSKTTSSTPSGTSSEE